MGGLCAVGSTVYMSVNANGINLPDELTDNKRKTDGSTKAQQTSPKQTKTSVSIQLVLSQEPESNGHCLIGAHPSLVR